MKINDSKPNVQTSGFDNEKMFSIQDTGMIFDILRNKMYADPIGAIAREISCNCRDAHREVGKESVPVKIVLPTLIDPHIRFIDNGPGISPDRLENVFIKYTGSTKRNDNSQTGGFGLGAKTPFSYSDTFTIITNVDGKKYVYACFIDETKIGKCIEMSVEDTTECNGTEIKIPVHAKDFLAFDQAVHRYTQYWKVKPNIVNSKYDVKTRKIFAEFDNWFAQEKEGYQKIFRAIVDGIEYPIDHNFASKYLDNTIFYSIDADICIKFNIGEINLSANREQIYVDDKGVTANAFKKRTETIRDDIYKFVSNIVEKYDSYLEANRGVYKNCKFITNINAYGNLSWQGKNLIKNPDYVDISPAIVTTFTKKKNSKDKISYSVRSGSTFSLYADYCFNDKGLEAKDLTPAHAKIIFSNLDESAQSVSIITEVDYLKREEIEKKMNFDDIEMQFLSDLLSVDPKIRKTFVGEKVIFFSFSNGKWSQVAYDTVLKDTNHKIFCKLKRNPFNLNSKTIDSDLDLNVFANASKDVSFYGLDNSAYLKEEFLKKKKIKDFEFFDEFSKEFKEKYMSKIHEIIYCTEFFERVIPDCKSIIDFIKDPDSPFLKRYNFEKEVSERMRSYNKNIIKLYTTAELDSPRTDNKFSIPGFDSVKNAEFMEKLYPMIKYAGYAFKYISDSEQFRVKDFVDYINIMDVINKEKNVKNN